MSSLGVAGFGFVSGLFSQFQVFEAREDITEFQDFEAREDINALAVWIQFCGMESPSFDHTLDGALRAVEDDCGFGG
jgi:hypothetical protein